MRRGQMLLEMVVAVGVVTVALTVLVQVVSKALSLSGSAKFQTEATGYATEAMEWIKGQRVVGWANIDKNNTYCLETLSWVAGTCSGYNLGGKYKREAIINNTAGYVTAEVDVKWQESGRTPKASQTTYFYRY